MEVWQFAAVLLAALALRRWCFELIRVQGNSMNATLRSGDILWVTRFDYRNRAAPAAGCGHLLLSRQVSATVQVDTPALCQARGGLARGDRVHLRRCGPY